MTSQDEDGTGLSILGWPLQVIALLLAPLVVVQPALAAGLLVLLFLGERMLGEQAGRSEHLATLAIVIGVIGAALCAPPRTTSETAGHLAVTLVLIALALVSLLPYLLRALGRSSRTSRCSAPAPRSAGAVSPPSSPPTISPATISSRPGCGACRPPRASGVGVLSEMSALQSRPAIQVAPVVFVTQTVIPVALAPILFGERFDDTPLDGVPLVLSLGVLVVGAALLARSPLLLALMEGERVSDASGRLPVPRSPARRSTRLSPDTEAGEPESSTTTTSPARIGR